MILLLAIKKINIKSFLLLISLYAGITCSAQNLSGTFISKFDYYYNGYAFDHEVLDSQKETGWKGERIYYQLLIWSDTDIADLDLSFVVMSSGNDKFELDDKNLRFGQFVKGDIEPRSCGGYPIRTEYVNIADALSSKPISKLNKDDTISVFIRIDIPTDISPGLYQGNLSINADGDVLDFGLEVDVLDMVLPEVSDWTFHLDLWQFPTAALNFYNNTIYNPKIEMWSDSHFNLIRPAYQLLADAGQKVITAHIKQGALGSASMIKWILKADNIWQYDYSPFDKYVIEMMSLGIDKQINCFSPLGWNEAVIPYWDESSGTEKIVQAQIGSTEYNERWDHFLTDFNMHLKSKGWFGITVLYMDEVSESKLGRVIQTVHENDPDWKLGIAYSHSLHDSTKSSFFDISGIIEDASNSGVSEDMISTFYTSCTQKVPNNYVTPLTSPAEMTWMAYYCANNNFDGYLRWAFDFWRNNNPFDIRDGSNTAGDFSFIYRSSNSEPIDYYSSLRLEMLREGIEDFEKINILRKVHGNSEDSIDIETMSAINEVLENFTLTSGENAKQLIETSQQKLNKISKGDLSNDGINK